MTLAELIQNLKQADLDAPLMFDAPSGRTGPGYHVTEFKLADVSSIDCGGNQSSWKEAILQIQDGRGIAHMPVGKFVAIAERSANLVDGLADVDLRIEFSAGNEKLEVLKIGQPEATSDAVIVPLGSDRAACKPMFSARNRQSSQSCC